ncbi:Glycine/D-amino acid oxidase [Chitinophaga costaii]|uniref:Glycine/D-amino acid oxidase n=1 Tax=Chitinophaga costaii TaxID=1335309 RepID=A0A1C3ZE04_9BACT|nr:FAD-dependent oxidoreductase [Chitinophaga costaii]PUZ30331.1 FAD-binding oxidoreductase [Chitinophaga costaii]SCB80490.1 Glycine/D-amino acid oxidase [Chitinophaga costaii]
MLSFWEQESFLQYDYIVIGSGIVGLSTALALRARQPNARVLVVERGVLPAGASTRNAGFACIGSLTELLNDLQTMPAAEVAALVAFRREGLRLLRARLGDDRIGYEEAGSYELIATAALPALNRLEEINTLLYPVLGAAAFTLYNPAIKDFGFSEKNVAALVRNNFEGGLHTGRMMRSLLDLALQQGIAIQTGCNVTALHSLTQGVRVEIQASGLPPVPLQAKAVAVCTNAFTKTLFPDLDLQPGRGQVLITAPVPGLPFKGIFHLEEGYFYFREIAGRILLGGGRNLDFAGEATTDFALNTVIQEALEDKLHTVILPGRKVAIDSRWTGIMAFGASKQPILEEKAPHIFLGVRMGGMGVAIGSAVGERLAEMMVPESEATAYTF